MPPVLKSILIFRTLTPSGHFVQQGIVDIRYQSPKYENGFLDYKKIINHDHVIVAIRYQSPKYENGFHRNIHFHI